MPDFPDPPIVPVPGLADHLALTCAGLRHELRPLADAEAGLRAAADRVAEPVATAPGLDRTARDRARSLALDATLRAELASHRRRRTALVGALRAAGAASRSLPDRHSPDRHSPARPSPARPSLSARSRTACERSREIGPLERSSRAGTSLTRVIVLDRAPPPLARAVAPALDDADEVVRIVCAAAGRLGPPAPPGEATMLEIAIARLELTLGLLVALLSEEFSGRADPWLLDALAERAVASGTLARGILGFGAVAMSPASSAAAAPTSP